MVRGFLVIVLAGALAGCGVGGDDPSPFADSHAPASLSQRFYPPEGWAWGFVQVGDGPVQRYGVAAPAVVPRAHILILPDYGETAETWFETVSDLNDRGFTVWVLEGVGQGGSERLTRHRDLGHVKSFATDVAAVKAMARVIIRPDDHTPLVILGQGTGAVIAALASERSIRPAGVILSSPVWKPETRATMASGFSWFGPQRVPGGAGWRRDDPDAFADKLTHDRWRGGVTHAWQLANPDLRMGAPTTAWLSTFSAAARQARRELGRIGGDVLTVEAGPPKACEPVGHCREVGIPGAYRALELEGSPYRNVWLAAVTAYVRALPALKAPG